MASKMAMLMASQMAPPMAQQKAPLMPECATDGAHKGVANGVMDADDGVWMQQMAQPTALRVALPTAPLDHLRHCRQLHHLQRAANCAAAAVNGAADDAADRLADGAADGLKDGDDDGLKDGAADGLTDGAADCLADGAADGVKNERYKAWMLQMASLMEQQTAHICT